MIVTTVIVALCLLLVIRVPIAFALGIAAWLYMVISGIDLIVMAQQVANGPDSWILLAMPLFVLAGLCLASLDATPGILRVALR